jgi:signal transduction histidine kinase
MTPSTRAAGTATIAWSRTRRRSQRRSSRHPVSTTAGHRQRGARGVGSLIRQQPDDGLRHLLGEAGALHRHAGGAQIESAYRREAALLAERSAAEERERIYRDLHDNLGARLLGLVHTAHDPQQAERAREALAEMRTLIATSRAEGGRLADLAAEWQLEAELRAEDARCRLD